MSSLFKKPKPRFTDEEKRLNKAFRHWIENPTNPEILKHLTWRIIDREVKSRMMKLSKQ